MPSAENSIFIFQELRYQIISVGFVLAVRSKIFLCDETCPCSHLSFEKGSTVLSYKVLQNVNWQLFGGG